MYCASLRRVGDRMHCFLDLTVITSHPVSFTPSLATCAYAPSMQVALRTNPAQWAEEFVDHPNNGHLLLMEFMRDLPKAAHAASKNPLLVRLPVCTSFFFFLEGRAHANIS